jgi:hypothetical protein
VPIALLLMDQAVVSGIGNVYRAELLFRARLNPHTLGRDVPEETVRALWRDWVRLLTIGVETGQMMTMDDLTPDQYRAAMAHRDDRHWVYHRTGLPCRVCGTDIVLEEIGARKLYWCPAARRDDVAGAVGARATLGWSHASEPELRHDRYRRVAADHRGESLGDAGGPGRERHDGVALRGAAGP